MNSSTRNSRGSLNLLVVIVILSTAVGVADQLVLEPSKDNTIWEDQSGALSNGAGVALFSGRTGQSRTTRALIAFDLSTIPAGSTINSVSLELNQSNTSNNNSSSQPLTLQLVLKNWGEGSSNASS
ncbi:MAG: DNRLRE domain-containing protein, partial [Acidobacteriota bacterium]